MSLFRRKKLTEAGARHSKVDAAHLQEAHDHLVNMGAQCNTEQTEALREAEALRVDDSFSSRIEQLRKAAKLLFMDPDNPYNAPYCYVRDCFDTDVVIQCGDAIVQIPYTMDGDTPVLGDPIPVDVAYIPADTDDGSIGETDGDEIVE